MSEKYPSKHWIQRFLKQHPEVKLGRPSGLDPKDTQMFNYTVVKEHFERLDAVLKEHGIPWENQYQIKGGGLELATFIEYVCTDGTSLVPGFIFAGSTIDQEATEIDLRIR
ncbi:hypothetical protein BD769DRAFT_1388145 [Suillus cothurnatus]|nr:hypothetical protein BD769DRAFT_1388145 [Suillus cothurnatus]